VTLLKAFLIAPSMMAIFVRRNVLEKPIIELFYGDWHGTVVPSGTIKYNFEESVYKEANHIILRSQYIRKLITVMVTKEANHSN
jgi:hypothetical protein